MSLRVGTEQKTKAKEVNIIDYMEQTYPKLVEKAGKVSLRLRSHRSVVIVKDGYFHNPSKQHHDGIELLMTFMGMTFQEAVRELSSFYDRIVTKKALSEKAAALKKQKAPYEHPPMSSDIDDVFQARQYLHSRGIKMTSELDTVVYPTNHNGHINIVFESRDCEYAEIRGTLDSEPTKRTFISKAKGSDIDGYFIIGEKNPDTIFVFETAFDAISYMVYNDAEPGCAYASIGGIRHVAAITRLEKQYPAAHMIIAFNNNEDSRKVANSLPYSKQFPNHKDWNEELLSDIQFHAGQASNWYDELTF